MKVPRSSYYEWLNSPKTEREKENTFLIEIIKIIFQKGRGSYGTRRIKRKLAEQGKSVSRRRIGRLLNQAGLTCKTKKKFKVTTDSKHNKPIAPNLLKREFTVSKPDRYYVGDITYISTQKGWLFLAVVIDLFSRKVVGWSMNNAKCQPTCRF
jgi:transposase InsO family protein